MTQDKINILWADDEIDLLNAQILFLQNKGYEVTTVTNGHDAVDECNQRPEIDIVFLDESMPGLSGLETLDRIKSTHPNLPVVMITKNEAENMMEDAIGGRIHDYLIKPVNPNQILLVLKKIIDNKRLISSKTQTNYQIDFRKIMMEINNAPHLNAWVDIYRKLIQWEIKLDESYSEDVADILSTQKSEANAEFCKFIQQAYTGWINKPTESTPIMSHTLMRRKILPAIQEEPVIVVLMDNLRYDQWKVIEPILMDFYRVKQEDFFVSILPSATQYSRNAIFSGMLPAEIEKAFPQYWKNDVEEGGKNLHEEELFRAMIKRLMRREVKSEYFKVTNVNHGKQLQDNILNYLQNDITVIVYNFIDMLSHARTEMEVLKELANDEKAYRSLTRSWFQNSPLWLALQKLKGKKHKLFITTDHGTIRVKTPSKVIGDRETTTNLRYKVGKNLQYERRDVLEIKNPAEAGLPRPNISSTFIFAVDDVYFLYPNNYTHFNNYYRNTFQHGGISLEEMICPIIQLDVR